MSSQSAVPVLAVAALAVTTLSSPVRAADGQLSASYEVAIGGFSVAKSNLIVKVENGLYAARVGYRSSGVGKMFSGFRGEAMSTGAVRGDRPVPATYKLDGKGDKKDSGVTMALAGGAVKSVASFPPLRDDEDRVPVKAEHQRGVVDPLSAILMPVEKASAELDRSACDRTLPIFDGWTRYDVKLSYKSTVSVAKPGYTGPAVVCGARWVPIAGHVPDRESTRFMQENQGVEVTLAPIGQSGFLAPIRISIPTRSGILVVEAEKFTPSPEKHAAR